jgi:methyltransferase
VTPAIDLLSLVTAERVGELWLARRDTARLLAIGGVETAGEHYPVTVILHAAWLAGLWWARSS